jgi:adenylate cyclase
MAEAKRRLAAILSADVAGYSRLMSEDDRATLEALKALRATMARHIEAHDGRVVNAPGDALLAEFPSAVEAVQAAADVQSDLGRQNAELAADRRMLARIGVNLGDVLVEPDGTLYGDGVNVAARMEALAEPGGICVSAKVFEEVDGKTGLGFRDIGRHQVKNIAKPVAAFHVVPEGMTAPAPAASPPRRRRPALLLAGVAAATASIVGLILWTPWVADTNGSEPAIAVLPFTNMSGDPEQEYFVDGIAEDLITELSRFDGLLVIARNSTFTYKGKAVDVRQVAEELGVRYVLEGGVRRVGNQVRVTAQLNDANTGADLWAERYDRDLTDIFAVQDEITREIINALRFELGAVTSTREGGPVTRNADAYDLYLQGRVLTDRRTAEANARAQDLFLQAIAVDPDFAAAYAELSWARYLGWYYAWPGSTNGLSESLTAAQKAVALDPFLPLAHARLATVQGYAGQLDEALGAARRAVELDANYATGHDVFSMVSMWAGNAEQALAAADRAARLDPYSFRAEHGRGRAYLFMADYDKAITAFRASLALNPDFGIAHLWLAATYGLMGREAEAKAQAAELLRLSPDFLHGGFLKSPARGMPEFARLLEGLRKAGLEIPDEPPAE